jgi:hypothetical protein
LSDDCHTIANVVQRLLELGANFRIFDEISKSYDPNLDFEVPDFGYWFTEENISVESVLKSLRFPEDRVLNLYR